MLTFSICYFSQYLNLSFFHLVFSFILSTFHYLSFLFLLFVFFFLYFFFIFSCCIFIPFFISSPLFFSSSFPFSFRLLLHHLIIFSLFLSIFVSPTISLHFRFLLLFSSSSHLFLLLLVPFFLQHCSTTHVSSSSPPIVFMFLSPLPYLCNRIPTPQI